MSAEALQRERRQMQAKHLWYNVDIRWSDLKDKLEVLAPTGLTRDDIWRHLFLTKQRKNPYEEGCYTGEDLGLVNMVLWIVSWIGLNAILFSCLTIASVMAMAPVERRS